MPSDHDAMNQPRFLIPLLLTITVIGVIDIVLDRPASLLDAHVVVDMVLVAVSLATAFYLWFGWRHSERSLEDMRGALSDRAEERDMWQQRTEGILRGLGEAIDEVLTRWGLTPAERETALLLLKGLSHKRIASMTERSERTVRQHAVSVYRKSELGGRAALSAFFLE